MPLPESAILEILVRHGYINQSDAEAVQASAAKNGNSIAKELELQGLIMPNDIWCAIAADAGMPFVENLDHIHEDAVKAVPKNFAQRYQIMPILKDGPILRIAISNPYDLETQDTLRNLLNTDIELVVAPPDTIQQAIKRYYGSLSESIDTLISSKENNDAQLILKQNTQYEEAAPATEGDAPIISMVNSMILDAHRMRASDIHLEPLEKRLRLRYRIDGVLQEMRDPPKRLQSAIISRIKIMSRMSIAEKRLPQDGRIQLTLVDGKQLDLRVSTIPTVHGEGIVMRILDKSSLLLGLPDLGFFSDDAATMERIINLPDGIFLVTGPTGSGKTTTLYACLNSINKPDRKIITVEDPVEYQLSGINQVPVNEEVGMTFAAALRSILRQAPNIIMIGEIRDSETASIAINASLTGHLVFSTLHTNDATSAVTRLIDIGIKPFLVASSVRAVMAQRLVRKVCSSCAMPYEPTEGELRALNLTPTQIEQAQFRRGRGCDKCRGSGYKGRLGIFEIFILDDEIRNMINDRQSTSAIRARARALGMRTLREDGIRKVLAGITTPEEVISTTLGDKN